LVSAQDSSLGGAIAFPGLGFCLYADLDGINGGRSNYFMVMGFLYISFACDLYCQQYTSVQYRCDKWYDLNVEHDCFEAVYNISRPPRKSEEDYRCVCHRCFIVLAQLLDLVCCGCCCFIYVKSWIGRFYRCFLSL